MVKHQGRQERGSRGSNGLRSNAGLGAKSLHSVPCSEAELLPLRIWCEKDKKKIMHE